MTANTKHAPTTTAAAISQRRKQVLGDLSLQLMDGFHVSSLLEGPLLDMIPPAHEEVVHHQPELMGHLNAILPGVGSCA